MSLKVTVALLAVLVASACAKAPLRGTESKTIIPGEYIVVLDEKLSDEEAEAHKSSVRSAMQLSGNTSHIHSEWRIGKGFLGYSVHGSEKILEVIRDMKAVKYVDHNMEVHALQSPECEYQEDNVPWGLHRTVSKYKADAPESEYYHYDKDAAGAGVDAYILDTGIRITHEQFSGGRAKWGYDTVDNPSPERDGHGHGTHVAGTVVGNTVGLARAGTAIAVRVLNDFGSGSYQGIIDGIEWVVNEHKGSPGKKSIVNMSLGGSRNQALNDAVEAALDEGVHFAVAAGNENQDACNVSPASSPSVTVAATDVTDKRSYFSNYGSCVDIFAPGSAVESAWNTHDSAYNSISGTSMASPHVAGVMAMLLSGPDGDALNHPATLEKYLKEHALKDYVGDPQGTDNDLLYNPCGDGDAEPDH